MNPQMIRDLLQGIAVLDVGLCNPVIALLPAAIPANTVDAQDNAAHGEFRQSPACLRKIPPSAPQNFRFQGKPGQSVPAMTAPG
jgi:hypothetical protein